MVSSAILRLFHSVHNTAARPDGLTAGCSASAQRFGSGPARNRSLYLTPSRFDYPLTQTRCDIPLQASRALPPARNQFPERQSTSTCLTALQFLQKNFLAVLETHAVAILIGVALNCTNVTSSLAPT